MGFSIFKSKKRSSDDELELISKEFFRYLNSIVIGIGSGDSAKELCKVKQIWDTASGPVEYLAALYLADGVAQIALSEAEEKMGPDAQAEIQRNYKCRKNRFIWAIKNSLGKRKPKKDKRTDDPGLIRGVSLSRTDKARAELTVRYSHMIKPYRRPWESA